MLQKANNLTVSGKHHHRGLSHQTGFTIIEVMIVLAIVGLIILIVLLALPALQRQSRNSQRDHSAQLIAAAVQECVTNNDGNIDACKTPASLGLTQKELGIFTGVHYGLLPDCVIVRGTPFGESSCYAIPTPDEPNWMFGLECKPGRDIDFKDPKETSTKATVVTYVREGGNSWLYPGSIIKCIDG